MKLYGSLNNRLEENRMFCDEIKVGMGATEYSWSDRYPYEVVAVKDQKHVTIRRMNHTPKPDSIPYSNEWVLTPDENAPTMEISKRGKYWYQVVEITPSEAKEILDSGDIDSKLWACANNFNLPEIVAGGKTKKSYHRINISFGIAEYHFDYEF